MAQLAIQGHVTRGKEVIEILEMLGGKVSAKFSGGISSNGYYINGYGNIDYNYWDNFNNAAKFTIEEFLEKYPYKVGDKVVLKETQEINTIIDMTWEDNIIYYDILSDRGVNTYCWETTDLQPYKETSMYLNEKANKQAEEIAEILEPAKEIMEEKTDTAFAPDLKGQDYSGKRFGYKMPNGYEFECVRKNEIILKPIEPKYPKTYEECCEVLDWNHRNYDRIGYKSELLCKLQVLLLCRDAYWKITGEQMGLGKPWEYDCTNGYYTPAIIYRGGFIQKVEIYTRNAILVFPTEEIRDAFYENFKELIELCKELL